MNPLVTKVKLIQNIYQISWQRSCTSNNFDSKIFELFKDQKIECIRGELEIKNDKLEILIFCYDGDLCDGEPTKLRRTAKFTADLKYISIFEKIIETYWNDYLEYRFQKEKELKKKLRIKEIEKELLNN